MFSHGCEQGVQRIAWQTNWYLSYDLLRMFAHYSRTGVPEGTMPSNLHFANRFALSAGLGFKFLIYCIHKHYQKVLWATCCTWNKDWEGWLSSGVPSLLMLWHTAEAFADRMGGKKQRLCTQALSQGNWKTVCHLGLVQSGLKYVF